MPDTITPHPSPSHVHPTTPSPAPTKELTPVQRALGQLSRLAAGIAGAALLGLVLVQGWQVFARYVLNASPSWTEPLTVLLLSTAMSLGAAAGVHDRRHFGFFLLAEALPSPYRRIVGMLAPLAIGAIGAVLAWWGWVLLLDGIGIRIAGAAMPESIAYLPLCVGGALMLVFAIRQAFDIAFDDARGAA